MPTVRVRAQAQAQVPVPVPAPGQVQVQVQARGRVMGAGRGQGPDSPYAGRMPEETARILLLGKPGCHLCDEARAVVTKVAAELGVSWEERDITASEEDTRLYWDQIPVTFVDGVQHDFWRVDERRLRAALTA